MSRRKSVRELERDLQYARAREAYNPPLREDGAVTQRRPKRPVQYNSIFGARPFTVQGSEAGIAFFGGIADLGLSEPDITDPVAPRGFKPTLIKAMQADGTPEVVRARGSGRPYIRYARGTRGSSVQSTFSAPISDTGAAATVSGVRTKFDNVSDAKKATVGAYGRIWIEWEKYPFAESGTGNGGA